MDKATPEEMRKSLVTVDMFKKAGIKFIALPVIDDDDNIYLINELKRRLELIVEMCEE